MLGAVLQLLPTSAGLCRIFRRRVACGNEGTGAVSFLDACILLSLLTLQPPQPSAFQTYYIQSVSYVQLFAAAHTWVAGGRFPFAQMALVASRLGDCCDYHHSTWIKLAQSVLKLSHWLLLSFFQQPSTQTPGTRESGEMASRVCSPQADVNSYRQLLDLFIITIRHSESCPELREGEVRSLVHCLLCSQHSRLTRGRSHTSSAAGHGGVIQLRSLQSSAGVVGAANPNPDGESVEGVDGASTSYAFTNTNANASSHYAELAMDLLVAVFIDCSPAADSMPSSSGIGAGIGFASGGSLDDCGSALFGMLSGVLKQAIAASQWQCSFTGLSGSRESLIELFSARQLHRFLFTAMALAGRVHDNATRMQTQKLLVSHYASAGVDRGPGSEGRLLLPDYFQLLSGTTQTNLIKFLRTQWVGERALLSRQQLVCGRWASCAYSGTAVGVLMSHHQQRLLVLSLSTGVAEFLRARIKGTLTLTLDAETALLMELRELRKSLLTVLDCCSSLLPPVSVAEPGSGGSDGAVKAGTHWRQQADSALMHCLDCFSDVFPAFLRLLQWLEDLGLASDGSSFGYTHTPAGSLGDRDRREDLCLEMQTVVDRLCSYFSLSLCVCAPGADSSRYGSNGQTSAGPSSQLRKRRDIDLRRGQDGGCEEDSEDEEGGWEQGRFGFARTQTHSGGFGFGNISSALRPPGQRSSKKPFTTESVYLDLVGGCGSGATGQGGWNISALAQTQARNCQTLTVAFNAALAPTSSPATAALLEGYVGDSVQAVLMVVHHLTLLQLTLARARENNSQSNNSNINSNSNDASGPQMPFGYTVQLDLPRKAAAAARLKGGVRMPLDELLSRDLCGLGPHMGDYSYIGAGLSIDAVSAAGSKQKQKDRPTHKDTGKGRAKRKGAGGGGTEASTDVGVDCSLAYVLHKSTPSSRIYPDGNAILQAVWERVLLAATVVSSVVAMWGARAVLEETDSAMFFTSVCSDNANAGTELSCHAPSDAELGCRPEGLTELLGSYWSLLHQAQFLLRVLLQVTRQEGESDEDNEGAASSTAGPYIKMLLVRQLCGQFKSIFSRWDAMIPNECILTAAAFGLYEPGCSATDGAGCINAVLSIRCLCTEFGLSLVGALSETLRRDRRGMCDTNFDSADVGKVALATLHLPDLPYIGSRASHTFVSVREVFPPLTGVVSAIARDAAPEQTQQLLQRQRQRHGWYSLERSLRRGQQQRTHSTSTSVSASTPLPQATELRRVAPLQQADIILCQFGALTPRLTAMTQELRAAGYPDTCVGCFVDEDNDRWAQPAGTSNPNPKKMSEPLSYHGLVMLQLGIYEALHGQLTHLLETEISELEGFLSPPGATGEGYATVADVTESYLYRFVNHLARCFVVAFQCYPEATSTQSAPSVAPSATNPLFFLLHSLERQMLAHTDRGLIIACHRVHGLLVSVLSKWNYPSYYHYNSGRAGHSDWSGPDPAAVDRHGAVVMAVHRRRVTWQLSMLLFSEDSLALLRSANCSHGSGVNEVQSHCQNLCYFLEGEVAACLFGGVGAVPLPASAEWDRARSSRHACIAFICGTCGGTGAAGVESSTTKRRGRPAMSDRGSGLAERDGGQKKAWGRGKEAHGMDCFQSMFLQWFVAEACSARVFGAAYLLQQVLGLYAEKPPSLQSFSSQLNSHPVHKFVALSAAKHSPDISIRYFTTACSLLPLLLAESRADYGPPALGPDGSPLNGPFQPSEVVSSCGPYTSSAVVLTGCCWLLRQFLALLISADKGATPTACATFLAGTTPTLLRCCSLLLTTAADIVVPSVLHWRAFHGQEGLAARGTGSVDWGDMRYAQQLLLFVEQFRSDALQLVESISTIFAMGLRKGKSAAEPVIPGSADGGGELAGLLSASSGKLMQQLLQAAEDLSGAIRTVRETNSMKIGHQGQTAGVGEAGGNDGVLTPAVVQGFLRGRERFGQMYCSAQPSSTVAPITEWPSDSRPFMRINILPLVASEALTERRPRSGHAVVAEEGVGTASGECSQPTAAPNPNPTAAGNTSTGSGGGSAFAVKVSVHPGVDNVTPPKRAGSTFLSPTAADAEADAGADGNGWGLFGSQEYQRRSGVVGGQDSAGGVGGGGESDTPLFAPPPRQQTVSEAGSGGQGRVGGSGGARRSRVRGKGNSLSVLEQL